MGTVQAVPVSFVSHSCQTDQVKNRVHALEGVQMKWDDRLLQGAVRKQAAILPSPKSNRLNVCALGPFTAFHFVSTANRHGDPREGGVRLSFASLP